MPSVRPGRAYPLGATFDGEGTNFALFSEHATGVTLCLFDDGGDGRSAGHGVHMAEARVALTERTSRVWHGYVAGVRPGQRYGFRVDGPYAPKEGHRFNPNKLLIDPYARAFDGKAAYDAPLYGDDGHGAMDERDSARGVPKSVIVDGTFDWGDDAPPDVPWHETVVYEAHVKGFTKRHPKIPPELRGTYAGLASPAAIAHFRDLGVTTIELMPVHEAMDEMSVARHGLTNYWGYSTLGYFAPDQRFASRPGAQVTEFKQMVKALHAAGLEVVLDVVYNHTCEGDHEGPTVGLRGIDNRSYYRLKEDDLRLYEDFTGCGNTLNMMHPEALKLVMDSLRYWLTEMKVDGFRFDLAPTLARAENYGGRLSSFFDIIHQDPILSRTKLIAEPWDLGAGGYQVGNFPILWGEWNGRYRDTVRRFWKGDKAKVGDMGYRLTGSSDLYEDDGRHPHASVNFVTAHDGFTLRDLVTYESKHNEANGEKNKDGSDDNASWNCGVEGETTDAGVRALRQRQVRNLLATLLLSQGVPMLAAGDEIGRTQGGNNNAYCQDNETSWLDWELDDERRALLSFTKDLIALRRAHPIFHRKKFFGGQGGAGSSVKDITWLRADGREMSARDWSEPEAAAVAFLVNGDALASVDDRGVPTTDDSFIVVMNAGALPQRFVVPDAWGDRARWPFALDTGGERAKGGAAVTAGGAVDVAARAVVVLRRARP